MDKITGSIKQPPRSLSSSVSFYPAPHRKVESLGENAGFNAVPGVDSAHTFLRAVSQKGGDLCAEVLHSSLPTNPDVLRNIVPRSNGFVHTVVEAYNNHHALIIRPDDVWLAILTQFSFYVNANAEALRSVFVAHEGKRELLIVDPSRDRYHMKPDLMACQMTKLMEEHIVDESLREWMMPSFTTTTATDTATSAVVMMGSMKEYFLYTLRGGCGLPKVTLEGAKKDWEDILRRLERLKKYGIQTITWYHLLRPIISRFVAAYDNPSSHENLDFWNKVAQSGDEGDDYSPYFLTGWITAFCVFSQLGKWKGNSINNGNTSAKDPRYLSAAQFVATHLQPVSRSTPCLTLDDFPYPKVFLPDVPYGYTYVDVKLEDKFDGKSFEAMFVAGSIGSHISSTMGTGTRDTLRPVPGWWFFIKKEAPQQGRWGGTVQGAMMQRVKAATASTQVPALSQRAPRLKPVSGVASTEKVRRIRVLPSRNVIN